MSHLQQAGFFKAGSFARSKAMQIHVSSLAIVCQAGGWQRTAEQLTSNLPAMSIQYAAALMATYCSAASHGMCLQDDVYLRHLNMIHLSPVNGFFTSRRARTSCLCSLLKPWQHSRICHTASHNRACYERRVTRRQTASCVCCWSWRSPTAWRQRRARREALQRAAAAPAPCPSWR